MFLHVTSTVLGDEKLSTESDRCGLHGETCIELLKVSHWRCEQAKNIPRSPPTVFTVLHLSWHYVKTICFFLCRRVVDGSE